MGKIEKSRTARGLASENEAMGFSMKSVTLFVRDVPKGTTTEDLAEFIEQGIPRLSRVRLGSRCRIGKPIILMSTDKMTLDTHFHGLVTVEPEELADQIIARLNLQPFMGRRVAIRRYIERSARNDRRHGDATPLESQDRRIEERRRSVAFEKLPFVVAHAPESKVFVLGDHFHDPVSR